MLTTTPPIATSPDVVWVFVTAATTSAVDVARVAYRPGTTVFLALPIECFPPDALMPTLFTGELLDGFRWATTIDVDAHADQFSAHGGW